jgi:phospholipase/carboxylesterase
MAPTGSKWRLDRPAEGFDADPPTVTPAGAPMCRTFLPDGYEPRYPYPLLVLFHPHGGNEEQVLELMPRLSTRNFVAVSIRGPQLLGVREDGGLACGWGTDDTHTERINEYVMRAVESVRRSWHVHTERVFLVGVCEGATAAYRSAFTLADKVAGVVALNGAMPRAASGAPLFRPTALRTLPVFLGHGIANAIVPFAAAARDYKLLYAAGADVSLFRYVTTHRLHPDMFRDVNRWVIDRISEETGRFAKSS